MLVRYFGNRTVGFANAFPQLVTSRWDNRRVSNGDVFEERPTVGLAGLRPSDFELMADPRDRPSPTRLGDLEAECEFLDGWIRRAHVPWSALPAPYIDARRIVTTRLDQLINAAVDLGMTNEEIPKIDGCNERMARGVLNSLRRFAARTAVQTDQFASICIDRKATPFPILASAKELAEHILKPLPAVESFLRRYRTKAPDCFVTVDGDDRRRNQSKYLYRTTDVLPALKEHFKT